ncbi:hypothetical protein MMC13_000804 [Lambiella insularis]|nr:hypothetical protein [Lambiella insularis]
MGTRVLSTNLYSSPLGTAVSSMQTILKYATELEVLLRGGTRPPTLATDLLKHIDEFSEYRLRSADNFREVDEQGTRSTAGSSPNAVRVLKSALKTTKLCLDQHHTALAQRIVERAAHYEETLRCCGKDEVQEIGSQRRDLSNEYYMMRIALAWRQDRLDLAENWLSKLESTLAEYDPVFTEKLADLLFEIGKERHEKAAHEAAVRWLERAHDVLSSQNLEGLSSDAGDLRIAISHTSARALMKVAGGGALEEAWNIANELDAGPSDKLVVLMLKLDLHDATSESDLQEYSNLLSRVVRTIHITEATFRTTLHYIHKLRSKSATFAHTLLEQFLLERLLDTGNPEWVDRLVVTIIWNMTTSTGIANEQNALRNMLDTLWGKLPHSIGRSATHAAQTLLWKRIETSYDHGQFVEAVAWCNLSLHEVFDTTGELNVGKIQRKLILCTLATSDYAMVKTTYSTMSDMAQIAQETQYLMYKVGLRSGDSELGRCLEAIYKNSAKDATLLYACVLEAQHNGQREQAISALQHVLDKYDYESPPGVNLPALLRCMARLLVKDLDVSGPRAAPAIEAVCQLFEGAAGQAKTRRRESTNQEFPLSEMDWFSRNTYNLALEYCSDWDPGQTLRLVQTCLKFIDLYPQDMDGVTLSDLSLRRMFCDFLGGSLLVMMAREEDTTEAQLQYYLSLRKHVKSFQTHFEAQIDSLHGGAKEDLTRKASTLLTFDFEAAVRLKEWVDANQIVKECQSYEDPKLYGMLADIMLSSDAPTETMITVLQQIVNISWRINSIDMTKLSRWVRCLFQLAMISNVGIAEFLLDQVSTLAKDHTMTYPAEELEWLATTSFNRAVDFYCASQDEACKRWAEAALGVAKNANDGGQLHELLETKYLSLRWQN